MQLESGVRQSERPERLVRHTIELLAEAIEAGADGGD